MTSLKYVLFFLDRLVNKTVFSMTSMSMRKSGDDLPHTTSNSCRRLSRSVTRSIERGSNLGNRLYTERKRGWRGYSRYLASFPSLQYGFLVHVFFFQDGIMCMESHE